MDLHVYSRAIWFKPCSWGVFHNELEAKSLLTMDAGLLSDDDNDELDAAINLYDFLVGLKMRSKISAIDACALA